MRLDEPMVTDRQVRLLRRRLMEGKTQEAAASGAGMSVRTARTWQEGPLPSESKEPRTWRTRKDPFDAVWARDVLPLLERDEGGILDATTVLAELRRRYPLQFHEGTLRTLQRRLRDWRAVAGPEKEVRFEQMHVPGREAAFDFTHMKDLRVTIAGEPFVHLLFVFRLSYSSWTWIGVALGETFEAVVAGLQGALWQLGGVPRVVRHDNLSAATRELRKTGGRVLTTRYQQVLDHYGLTSTRIEPGEAHQNGIAEKANDLVKTWVDQALVLRGSRDFASVEAYLAFARAIVDDRNGRRLERVAEDRARLRPLPSSRMPEYTDVTSTVRVWSTVRVSGRTYSVPSRLIGHEVVARLHADVVEIRYGDRTIEAMPRLRGEEDVRIDYRHVIWSLVRKPGAFARYRYREELFPTPAFRAGYDALVRFRGERADVEYVRVLHLAASTMESKVEQALVTLLEGGQAFDYVAVKALAEPPVPTAVPTVRIGAPDLKVYDQLLEGRCA
jgi:hypothetical protein